MRAGRPILRNAVTRALVAASLLAAALAQFLGLLMSGGGHGWAAPFFFSLLLWLAYPAAALATRRRAGGEGLVPETLVGAAGLADLALLLLNDWPELGEMIDTAPVLVILWLLLWLGWQVPALLALKRKRRVPTPG